MRVNLKPDERTLYHTHAHDRAAVELCTTSITQQKVGERKPHLIRSSPATYPCPRPVPADIPIACTTLDPPFSTSSMSNSCNIPSILRTP
jgi:hypothetical protein